MGKALDDAMKALNKTYGDGTIIQGDEIPDVGERILSSSIDLDIALNGGYPKGRIVEIYGPESSGKTTLAIHAIANEQASGGVAAFVDYEHAFNRGYAQNLGVDLEKLIFIQPTTAEEGLEITDQLIRTGEVTILVIDSVAAMVPKTELDGEMGDQNVGKHAKLMSQAMRKLTGVVAKSECCLVFINQLRENIGVMWGSPETTTGGKALKFYASVRIDIRGRAKVKDSNENIIGTETHVKIVKNKVGIPHKEAKFLIEYGFGILKERDILRKASELKIVQKKGSWFHYNETSLGQGENKVVSLLIDNPDLTDEIYQKILKKLEDVES